VAGGGNVAEGISVGALVEVGGSGVAEGNASVAGILVGGVSVSVDVEIGFEVAGGATGWQEAMAMTSMVTGIRKYAFTAKFLLGDEKASLLSVPL